MRKAAIAKFIGKELIGITLNSLNSLDELDALLANLKTEDYAIMISNVEKIKAKVASGHYLTQAIKKVVEMV